MVDIDADSWRQKESLAMTESRSKPKDELEQDPRRPRSVDRSRVEFPRSSGSNSRCARPSLGEEEAMT
jgi:hypothetical protein